MRWLLAAVALATSCAASSPLREGDRFVHRERGYSVAVPRGAWQRVAVTGAELAFRNAAGTTLSLSVRCRGPRARLSVLGRHLRLGIGPHALLRNGAEAGPWPSAGDVWVQAFDVERGGRTLHFEAVTSLQPPCVYDWILSGEEDLAGPRVVFRDWWHSFRGPTPSSLQVEAADGEGAARPDATAQAGETGG